MDDIDGHVISFEEAVRKHRAAEDTPERKGVIREVRLSDAMNHLLEEEGSQGEDATHDGAHEEGPTPGELRHIVERDFAHEGGRSGPEPEERPRPHLVREPEEDHGGQLCSFETHRCWDPVEHPDGPPAE